MVQKVISYQVADAIDLKRFTQVFKAEISYSDPAELFYRTDTDQFVYVFKYGAVCFLNYEPLKISGFLQLITPFCKNLFAQNLTDEFLVETNTKELKVGFNKIE